MSDQPTLSFVIPCLNEAISISQTIEDCRRGGSASGVAYEIIVADNGSEDGSQAIAYQSGCRVVDVPVRGYGAALSAGIKAAKGRYVLMGDADGTYNFASAPLYLVRLRAGADLVMGNRFAGRIEPGAMPLLHRWLGNPVLSGLGRLFFGIRVHDFHCGLRGFDRQSIENLALQSTGMEFASEMVIKASLRDLIIEEVPADLRCDHPERKPHLRTWRDGWRHLKFMLSFSPKYSFLFFSYCLFALSVVGFLCFFFAYGPFSGPNTLIVSSFSFFSGLALLSDYVTTRVMFAESYGKPNRFGVWLHQTIIRPRHGIDRLYQLAAVGLILGLFMLLVALHGWTPGSASDRISNLSTYITALLLSFSLFAYLTAAKISTLRSLSSISMSSRV